MHILYLDDAGSASNPTERHFVLGGVALFERQVYWLSRELDEVVQNIGWPPEETASIELRASSILSGNKRWRKLEKSQRPAVVRHGLAALNATHGQSVLFASVIDKAAVSPEDPVEHAFEQLCNRFDRYLLRKHRAGDTQRGLLVLDNHAKETRLRALATEFREIGHRWGSVANFADVPFFVDSKATRPIQYADLVAHATWRYFEYGEAQYFDVIKHAFDSEGGVVHGLHHYKRATDSCACPACAGPAA